MRDRRSSIGPSSVAATAAAFWGPGTTSEMARQARIVDIVTVSATRGTSSNAANAPSRTCWCRLVSSISTGFTTSGSSKSATCGSLNAR